jgi:pyruvate kinase
VPVICGSQVLDQLAKTGRPSRGDHRRSDGVQTECVMLNKGPLIIEAISVLEDILRRMGQRQRQ